MNMHGSMVTCREEDAPDSREERRRRRRGGDEESVEEEVSIKVLNTAFNSISFNKPYSWSIT